MSNSNKEHLLANGVTLLSMVVGAVRELGAEVEGILFNVLERRAVGCIRVNGVQVPLVLEARHRKGAGILRIYVGSITADCDRSALNQRPLASSRRRAKTLGFDVQGIAMHCIHWAEEKRRQDELVETKRQRERSAAESEALWRVVVKRIARKMLQLAEDEERAQ